MGRELLAPIRTASAPKGSARAARRYLDSNQDARRVASPIALASRTAAPLPRSLPLTFDALRVLLSLLERLAIASVGARVNHLSDVIVRLARGLRLLPLAPHDERAETDRRAFAVESDDARGIFGVREERDANAGRIVNGPAEDEGGRGRHGATLAASAFRHARFALSFDVDTHTPKLSTRHARLATS